MAPEPAIEISLDAVIVSVTEETPRLLVIAADEGLTLPSSPLSIFDDITLERGARRVVQEQTGLTVGYAEQLYTFGDRDRLGPGRTVRPVSVAYLALVEEAAPSGGAHWVDVYDLLPWEDQREGSPDILGRLRPAMDQWARKRDDAVQERVQVAFDAPWDGIRVVERYELLYEAGLVQEHAVDRGAAPGQPAGQALRRDHRRIVSMALSRTRGKLTYRPVVFELLPERFTLLELQRTVESLAGVPLHKQNFRRLVEHSGLVEGTGERVAVGRGRPAELFRYRQAVVLERPRQGVGLPYR